MRTMPAWCWKQVEFNLTRGGQHWPYHPERVPGRTRASLARADQASREFGGPLLWDGSGMERRDDHLQPSLRKKGIPLEGGKGHGAG